MILFCITVCYACYRLINLLAQVMASVRKKSYLHNLYLLLKINEIGRELFRKDGEIFAGDSAHQCKFHKKCMI